MHGEQVAVGTVLVLMLAEELVKLKPDFEKARAFARSYDEEAWKKEIERAYGTAAGEVFQIEAKAKKNDIDNRLQRIDSMEKNWDTIVAQLKTLPSAAYLRDLLKDIGCPAVPADIKVDDAILKDTFMYCKETRPRYTIFQTVYDLGLMDELSDKIISALK